MNRANRQMDSILVTVFVLVLVIPLCIQLIQVSSEGEKVLEENRVLAEAPPLPEKLTDWMQYSRKFEAFYNDKFGLRTSLLSIAKTLKLELGINFSHLSVAGRDGWLFLPRRPVEQRLLPFPSLSETQLQDYSDGMTRVKNHFNSRGIAFVHFVAPEKQSIYPEYMPDSVAAADVTPLDQVNQALASSDFYVDIKNTLLEYKIAQPERPLYFRMDSHWNCWGAFLAYREVVQTGLSSQGIKVLPVSEADFVYRDLSDVDSAGPFSAAYWLSALKDKKTKYECLLEESPLVEMHFIRRGWKKNHRVDMPHINGEIQRPEAEFTEFGTLFKTWRSTDRRGQSELKAIILRDSFASRFAAYFSRTFADILYIHHLRLEEGTLEKQLDSFQPDVVIYEYAERNLNSPVIDILEPLEASLGLGEGRTDGGNP